MNSRLARLLVIGALLILIAYTVHGDLVRMTAYMGRVPLHRQSRVAVQMEAARTLLDRGRLYSLTVGRAEAAVAESKRQPETALPVDIGPWLQMPADAPVRLAKDILSPDDFGESVLVAATFALVGVQSIAVAGWWLLPFQAANLLGCFLIGRRLGNAACGLAAAALVAQLEPLERAVRAGTMHTMPVYATVGLGAALVTTRGKHPLAFGLVAGLALALANQVRSVVGFLWLAVALGMLIRFGWRKAAVATLGCLLAMATFNRALAAHLAQYSTSDRVAYHPRWHTMLAGLGEFPNPYGFDWDDATAAGIVHERDPEAKYLSPEYETLARRIFLDTVKRHPVWYAGLLGKRLQRVLFPASGLLTPASALPALAWKAPPWSGRMLQGLALVAIGFAVMRPDRRALATIITFGYFVGIPVLTTAAGHIFYLPATVGLLVLAPVGAYHVVRVLRPPGRRAWHVLVENAKTAPRLETLRAAFRQLERTMRVTMPVVFVVVAGVALWQGVQLVRFGLPWSASEGYAAALAAAPRIPSDATLLSVPQAPVTFPLLPVAVRGLDALSGLSALQVSRILGLLAGAGLAAAAGALARRGTGSWSAALVAACSVLASTAVPIAQGIQPALVGAGAGCLWALVFVLGPHGRASVAGATCCYAAALLLEPGSLPWGLVLLCAGVWRGRAATAAAVVGGGLALALVGLWALGGRTGLVRWWTVWEARPLPVLFSWTAWAFVVRAAALPAMAGAVVWLARGREITTEFRVLVLAVLTSGLSLLCSPSLATSASIALLLAWAVVQWSRAASAPPAVALLATLLLFVFGIRSAVDRGPAQSAADRAQLARLTATMEAAAGPVLLEGWYGLAANAGRPPLVHAQLLPNMVANLEPIPVALLDAIERQTFAGVVYTGASFGQIPPLRRALLSFYEPAAMFRVQSAEGAALLTLMRPRAEPGAYRSPWRFTPPAAAIVGHPPEARDASVHSDAR